MGPRGPVHPVHDADCATLDPGHAIIPLASFQRRAIQVVLIRIPSGLGCGRAIWYPETPYEAHTIHTP